MRLTATEALPVGITKGKVYDGQFVVQSDFSTKTMEAGFLCFTDNRQWVLCPAHFFVPLGEYGDESRRMKGKSCVHGLGGNLCAICFP